MVAYDSWLDALANPETELTFQKDTGGHQRRQATIVIPERRKDYHILVMVTRGRMPGHIAGKELTVEPGQALWLPPQVVNGFTWDTELRWCNAWFALKPEPDIALPPLHIEATDDLRSILEAIGVEIVGQEAYRERKLRSLVTEACIAMLRGRSLHKSGSTLSPQQRRHLENWLAQRHHLRVNPDDLANELGLGADWFRRIFRRTYGQSPRTWILQQRMHAAADALLDPTPSVATISEQFGYEAPSLFSRQFKKVLGEGPAAWRRRQVMRSADKPSDIYQGDIGALLGDYSSRSFGD